MGARKAWRLSIREMRRKDNPGMSLAIMGFWAIAALVLLGALAVVEAEAPTWSAAFWRFVERMLDR
jgi:hypothetical protein